MTLQQRAAERGFNFSAIGVAVDWVAAEGLRYLEQFGTFGEVMAGRQWFGVGARMFMFERVLWHSCNATVNDFVRDTHYPDADQPVGAYSAFNERLLVRKTGVDALQRWLERRAPMSTDIVPR